jgi:hypothetical protein
MRNGSRLDFDITKRIYPFSLRELDESHFISIINLDIGRTIVLSPSNRNEKYYDICLIKRKTIVQYYLYLISITTSDSHDLVKDDEIFFHVIRELFKNNGINMVKIYVYYLTKLPLKKILPIKSDPNRFPKLENIIFRINDIPFKLNTIKSHKPMCEPETLRCKKIKNIIYNISNSNDMRVLMKLVKSKLKSK